MSGRALSFGVIAETYERFRPGYPSDLFDLVMAYAGRPIHSALEIGAGTGKATRLFARPGITVTATDPDPAMLAELRRHVPAGVRTRQAAFEDLLLGKTGADRPGKTGADRPGKTDVDRPGKTDVDRPGKTDVDRPGKTDVDRPGEVGVDRPGEVGADQPGKTDVDQPGEEAGRETYGLVYAAAALHWTRPEGRWPRVAALLEPGGVFASFGGPFQLTDPAVAEAFRVAREPFLASDDIPSPDGTPPEHAMQWPGTELRQSEWFTDVRQVVVERRLTMSGSDFVGHLSTVSAYLTLPAREREEVLSRIGEVLPPTVEITADVIAHLARRR